MDALRTSLRRPIVLSIGVLGSVLVAGCYATVHPAYVDGYYVYEDDAVYDYESYPRFWYGGRWVYLVGDRWYYSGPSGWVYFRTEPPGLYAHRHHYYSSRGYAAPPAYGAPPRSKRYAPAPPPGPHAYPAPAHPAPAHPTPGRPHGPKAK